MSNPSYNSHEGFKTRCNNGGQDWPQWKIFRLRMIWDDCKGQLIRLTHESTRDNELDIGDIKKEDYAMKATHCWTHASTRLSESSEGIDSQIFSALNDRVSDLFNNVERIASLKVDRSQRMKWMMTSQTSTLDLYAFGAGHLECQMQQLVVVVRCVLEKFRQLRIRDHLNGTRTPGADQQWINPHLDRMYRISSVNDRNHIRMPCDDRFLELRTHKAKEHATK
ncbi:hypothetical protein CLF_101660 [Clonorchis sinensis]|uniref:Uncharacterized protein n=1 Tax=Clonorchis sinensis TaxID=79923 RepID=G7Y693_CLOSI|nr:hypothetical protein CLF_101660 [Clonorchis sinensis]